MPASPFEFRYRYLIHGVIYVLGLVAPWNYAMDARPAGSAHTWGFLSTALAKAGFMSLQSSFKLVLIVGILCAAIGAGLRVWGSAYLGFRVVQDSHLHAESFVADGPYRHLRNPLYLGTFFHSMALALLMPPTGALFSLVAIGVLQFRLIRAEEIYLSTRLGSTYSGYCGLVPRLLPAVVARLPASTQRPRWVQALVAETSVLLLAISFAVFGWQYNPLLLIRCFLIGFGLSLIAGACLPRAATAKEENSTRHPRQQDGGR